MLTKTRTLIAAIAAASLVTMPMAAQANTRAGDNGRVYTASSVQPGAGVAAEGEDIAGGAAIGDIIAYVLVTIWFTGLGFVVADASSDSEKQSAGAN